MIGTQQEIRVSLQSVDFVQEVLRVEYFPKEALSHVFTVETPVFELNDSVALAEISTTQRDFFRHFCTEWDFRVGDSSVAYLMPPKLSRRDLSLEFDSTSYGEPSNLGIHGLSVGNMADPQKYEQAAILSNYYNLRFEPQQPFFEICSVDFRVRIDFSSLSQCIYLSLSDDLICVYLLQNSAPKVMNILNRMN